MHSTAQHLEHSVVSC